MLNRFLRPFAYILLLLIPLQGIAAVNMLVCNSVMHMQQLQQASQAPQAPQIHDMPCHAHLKSMASVTQDQADTATPNTHGDHHKTHTSTCKNSCNAVCASLCAITVLPTNAKSVMVPNASAIVSAAHFSYVSVTLPSLQRPPIFLS
jgi:hypothetical protein